MLNAEEGLCPLIALIHVLKPECQCVYNSMLSNWYLIKDRQSECTFMLFCCKTTFLFWHSRMACMIPCCNPAVKHLALGSNHSGLYTISV